MDSAYRLIAGVLTTMALATSAMVVLPYTEVHRLSAPEGLRAYSAAELRGRQQYINLGCMTCHSQQPRGTESGVDGSRGWGRPSVPEDYVHDAPPLLGTMRTGPDLFNIGSRQPSTDWHLGHLYQPRAYVAGSNMPAFPFLFEHKRALEEGDWQVRLPEGVALRSGVVVARPEALDLVKYLLALDRTYPAPQL